MKSMYYIAWKKDTIIVMYNEWNKTEICLIDDYNMLNGNGEVEIFSNNFDFNFWKSKFLFQRIKPAIFPISERLFMDLAKNKDSKKYINTRLEKEYPELYL